MLFKKFTFLTLNLLAAGFVLGGIFLEGDFSGSIFPSGLFSGGLFLREVSPGEIFRDTSGSSTWN